MLLAASEVKEMTRNNPSVEFVCRSKDNHFRGYADHIGFFRHMGFLRGNQPGQAWGSTGYIPIQSIDANSLKEASGDRPYAEIVEEKSAELAGVLTQCQTGGVYTALQYALREMLRNSVEHSLCDKVVLFGQFWPRKDLAEIVLYDNGVGIRQTLTESGVNPAATTEEALELALRPGVSGVSEYERKHQHENWRNSGFGLYVTSRFCSERGIFRVISQDAGLTLSKHGRSKHDWRFHGTCIQMKLDTSDLEKSGDRILEIVTEGEVETGLSGEKRPASKSSKSVSGNSLGIQF